MGALAAALTKVGFGTLALGGSSSYTGPTVVSNGTLSLDFSQATAPADGNNILYHGVAPGALTLGGAPAGLGNNSLDILSVTGKSGATTSQSFASTSFQIGQGIVQVNNNGGTANLNLGALSVQPGGHVIFVPPTSGSATTISTTTSVANTGGILGGWAVYGNLTSSNFNPPGATNYPTVNLPMGTTWATVDANGKIVGYTGYTDYGARVGTDTGPIISTGNLRPNVSANTNLKFDATAVNAAVTPIMVDANSTPGGGSTTNINTIAFNSQSFATLSIGTGNTLRLGQYGGIFKQDLSANNNSLLYIGGTGGVQSANGLEAGSGLSTQDIGTLTAGPATGGPGQIVVTANNGTSESAGTLIFSPRSPTTRRGAQ